MEVQKRRRYTTEYKQDVAGMIESKGMQVSELAKDMGVRVELLYRWKQKYGIDSYVIAVY